VVEPEVLFMDEPYIEVDGRNNFNAIPTRLQVELFDNLGANAGPGHEIVLQKV